jgi:8-amino-7-oxononanoate synthase
VIDLEEGLRARLRTLEEAGLLRELREPSGIDFSSNDYLGLAGDANLRRAIVARLADAERNSEPLLAPASRLLRGHTAAHAALESRLAAFKGTEAALLFPSGYQANVGLLTALLEPNDRAISDRQNHASLIDGLRLAGCRKAIVPHLDLEAIERELARPHPQGRTFVVTESLFSMDGDIAPLDLYADLAERYGAALIVDDSHATGLYGAARGSGLAERFGVERRTAAIVSTCGKALALAGAFVAGSRPLIDLLVNRCRPFVFSTATPPLLALGLHVVLDALAAQPERRQRAHDLASRLRSALARFGPPGDLLGKSPIVPLILGENRRAVAVADLLQRRGFDVRAVRPPTVPQGTARLRISVHADRSEEEIDALAAAVPEAVAEVDRGESAHRVESGR